MKNIVLSTGMIVSCFLVCSGQELNTVRQDEANRLRLKKQILIGDLESQIKAIPVAAVRVWARYKIASWLWKDGKDDTGRAEDIAVAGIDDHYKYREFIPSVFSFAPRLLALLDVNATDSAKRLKEKYAVSPVDELDVVSDLLAQTNGDKRAVDIAIRALSQKNGHDPDLAGMLIALSSRGSSEMERLLVAILAAEAAGRIGLPISTIDRYADAYNRPDTPIALKMQFLNLAFARCRNVAALTPLDHMACYRTLQRMVPSMAANDPQVLAESGPILALLKVQVSPKLNEANDSNERRKNSSNRLAQTVADAEKEEDPVKKYVLYRSAAALALTDKKFDYAVDLMEKASQIEQPKNTTPLEFRIALFDQFYSDVVTQSLLASQPESSNYAVRRMNDPLSKATGLAKVAAYYVDNTDANSSIQAYDEAIKNIGKIESSDRSCQTLIDLIPTAQKLDQVRVYDLSKSIAQSINAIPSPGPDDKPGTKGYSTYVRAIMRVIYSLQPALTALIKVNKPAVNDIAGRIQKKEVRFAADYVVVINSLESLFLQK